MGKRIDLTGQRFGRLIALEDIGTKWRRRLWLCQCDCGKTTKVITGVLRFGKTKSCGCLNREPTHALPLGLASFNECFATYKDSANRNGRTFKLTKEEFRKLTSSVCHYCGEAPTNKAGHGNNNGVYRYNGIDRVDSALGYVIPNCVPCCKKCNVAKHNYSEKEFYVWIKKAYTHLYGGPA